MRKLFVLAVLAFFATTAHAQSNLYSTGVCVTDAAPAFNPGRTGCKIALDTSTQKLYKWKVGTTWVAIGDGIDHILGGIPPAYTPTKWQSLFAANDSSELYHYTNSAWVCMNCVTGATYTAGTGISISGSNVISNTGDLSTTNELNTGFGISTTNLRITDAGGNIDAPLVSIAPVQSVAAADFDLSAGALSLDYTNAQKATDLVPGFLTAADWTTFNNKLSVEVDGSITNEIQTLSFTNPNLSISGGNIVDLSGLTPTQLWADGTQEIYPTDITDFVSIGTTTANSKLDVTTDGIGVTQTNTSGLVLSNNTAAAAGAQQISPALRWRANGWKTTATAASQSIDFRQYVLPVQGTTSPSGSLVVESSTNGGAYTSKLFAVRDDGVVGVGRSVSLTANAPYSSIVANADFTGQIGAISYANASGGSITGVVGFIGGELSFTGSDAFTNVRGIDFSVFNNNTSTSNVITGGHFSARNNSTTSRASSLTGIRAKSFTDNQNGGTVGTIQGVLIESWGIGSSGATGTNVYGLRVDNITNAGIITNTQGVYIGDVTTGTQTNQAYSINVTDTDARSFFAGKFVHDATNTATGTTGNQTINKPSGTVNIAAGGTTVTVTNSLVTTSSIVIPVIRTNDATATIKNCVPGSGSFVITLTAAATAEISIGFVCYN